MVDGGKKGVAGPFSRYKLLLLSMHRRRKVGHSIKKTKKAPVFTLSCVAPVGTSCILEVQKYTEKCSTLVHVSPCTGRTVANSQ